MADSPAHSTILRRAIELTRRNQQTSNSSATALAEEVRRLRSDLSRYRQAESEASTPRPSPKIEPVRKEEYRPTREFVMTTEPQPRRECCCCCRGCRSVPSPSSARAASSQTPLDLPEKVRNELDRLRKENLRLVSILNRTKFQHSQSKGNTVRLLRPSGFRP